MLVDYIPRNALDKIGAEMVEGDGDLHGLVEGVPRVRAQEHHLVVVTKVIVGDGDAGGGLRHIYQPVGAV